MDYNSSVEMKMPHTGKVCGIFLILRMAICHQLKGTLCAINAHHSLFLNVKNG